MTTWNHTAAPRLPHPRGPVSDALCAVLTQAPGQGVRHPLPWPAAAPETLLEDEDRLLALWTIQGLAYHGYDGVADRWEVDPELVRLRLRLEDDLEAAVRAAVDPAVRRHLPAAGDRLPETLFALPDLEFAEPPSMAAYARRSMTLPQWREMLILKSAYQLKEGDPHSFAIPRLPGPAQVAMLEIQYDEYGTGRPEAQHARLFATAMEAVGLRTDYGGYVDAWPASVLAANTALGWWASRRDWAPAVAGHLAMIETTSSLPCGQYVRGARRLELPRPAWEYFDEHVEADAAHEQIALRRMCPAVAAAGAQARERLLFGFLAGLYLEGRVAEQAIDRWRAGSSALRAVDRVGV